jgi:putative transposase
LVTANLGQRHAETSYGIAVEELTPAVPWSAYSLRKLWNQAKDELTRYRRADGRRPQASPVC